MARFNRAQWRPIPVNYTANGQVSVRGVVVHIMAGTLSGTDAWFRNPAAQASSHFGTGKDGRLYQWVDARNRAWAQGSGNRDWLSVENEGVGGDRLTEAQIDRNAQVLAWAHVTYQVPLKVASSPRDKGLGYHAMGGAAWGGHTQCPGPKIVKQLPEIVRRAKLLVQPEEDPLAGYTKKDIYDAVWKTDAVPAPKTSSTIDTNPTWAPVSVLSDIVNRVRSTEATVKAQGAALNTLAEAVAAAGQYNPQELVAKVEEAVQKAVQDVCGPSEPDPGEPLAQEPPTPAETPPAV